MILFPYFLKPFQIARPSVNRFMDVAIHSEHFPTLFESHLKLRQVMDEMVKEFPVATKDGYQVTLDVRHFKPEEITVKTVDNLVVIEGKHEERHDDHGLVSREFVRKYELPKGVDLQQIVSNLSSDGLLTVKAPISEIIENEKLIEIHRTGPAKEAIKEGSENK